MVECAATAMCSRRASKSRAANVSAKASMSAIGPDTTHSSGPFTAASETPGGSSLWSASSASGTLSIAPAGSRSKMSPADRNDSQRVLEGKDPGQAGRGVLAEAMSGHRRRADAP